MHSIVEKNYVNKKYAYLRLYTHTYMYIYIYLHNVNISIYNIILYLQAMRLGFMKIIDKERRMSKGGGGKDEVYGFMSMPKKLLYKYRIKIFN